MQLTMAKTLEKEPVKLYNHAVAIFTVTHN